VLLQLPSFVLGQKQNPRREWRREAPPFSSWVLLLSSYTAIKPLMGLIFNSQKCLHAFVNWYYSRNLYQDKSKPKKEIVALSATISFLGLKGRFASLLF
jgi:hypothetical protein